jgi:hypothetical protein
MYLDYETYKQFGGSISDETAYNNLEYKARTYIDLYTFDRLKRLTVISEKIQRCMFEIIEFINKSNNADKVSSFSNDGISVNLANETTDEQEKINILKLYLSDYMYRGADFKYPKGDIVYPQLPYNGIYYPIVTEAKE